MSVGRSFLFGWAAALGVALASTSSSTAELAGVGAALREHHRPMEAANQAAAVSARSEQLTSELPAGLGLGGRGVVVGVWDQGTARISHEDLTGRLFSREASGAADHSTHVAGTVAGTGISRPAARGIAPEALLLTHDWSFDLAELRERAPQLAVSVHAYGSRMGWAINPACSAMPSWLGRPDEAEDRGFGKYGPEARAVDTLAYEAGILSVWAAGNERQEVGASGEPHFHFPDCAVAHTDMHIAEVDSAYDTMGLQLAAKNTLVVGASAHIDMPPAEVDEIAVLPFSSFGPMDDGRIKPDVIASGAMIYSATAAADDSHASYSGTSSSAAVVAGTIALLTEHHRALNDGTDLPAEAMRAVVLHAAVAATAHGGPSYRAGYGLLDAKRAADLISADAMLPAGRRQIALGVARSDGAVEVRTDSIPAGTALRVTLTWSDPPAPANQGGVDDPTPALVNDLDVELIAPDGRTTHYPWSLDRRAPADEATRSEPNRSDNAEIVDVTSETAGAWTVRVSTHGELYRERPQRFALVASTPFEQPEAMSLAAPRTILIEAEAGQSPADTLVPLRLRGEAESLAIEARADVPWLTVVGHEAVALGPLVLRAATDDLSPGLHFATVALEHDNELAPRALGVVLRVSCTPDCSGRACGIDPLCGSVCGTCGVGEHCASDATCASWMAGCPAADLGSTPAQLVTLGTTQGQGDESEGSCGGAGAEDVAFSWTAPEAGVYRISTDGSALDTVLYVRDSCDGLELACNDNGGSVTSALSIALESQQEIIVVVDGASSSSLSSDFHLSIQEATCPDADLGSRLGRSIIKGSTASSTDRATGSCSRPGDLDAAFSWTAPATAAYTFSTAASDSPHTVFIRRGACSGDELGCSSQDDQVVLELTEGERVVVFVEPIENAGGSFVLGITSSAGLCAGNCGGTPDEGTCFCDPACVAKGDCCEDACSTCGSCCVPQCEGRACGDDGCGGSCGACAENERCDTGECVADPCAGLSNGAVCDDGDACTSGDQCVGGRCGGAPIECRGGDACADGECRSAPCESSEDGCIGDAGAGDASTDEPSELDGGVAAPDGQGADCGCSVPSQRSSRGAGVWLALTILGLGVRRMKHKHWRWSLVLSAFCVSAALACGTNQEHGDDDSQPDEQERQPGDGDEMRDGAQVDQGAPDSGDRDHDGSHDEDAGASETLTCGEGNCDLLDPLSCGEGEGCFLMIDEEAQAPRSRCDVAGAGLDGDSCTSPADCSAGLDCTSFDGNGTCRRYCCALNATAGCPAGQYCRVALEDMSNATGVALCDRCDGCDLTDAASCGDDRGCYPLGLGCSACLRAGSKGVGELCELADECEPGTACVSVGEQRRCSSFCVRESGQCPDGQSCEAVLELMEAVGVCL